MRDKETRRVLAIVAVLNAVALVYASMLPVRYRAISLAEAWELFLQMPWAQLGVEKRADWVANGLIMVPLGYCCAGAIHYGRRSQLLNQFSLIGFLAVHALYVCAIELMQAWFPPRVMSWNDVAAGYIGGVAGFLVWLVLGERSIAALRSFKHKEPGFRRLFLFSQICAAGMVVFNLLPLDVMLTKHEWALKNDLSRLVVVPFSDWTSFNECAKSIVLSGWAFPLGVVLALAFTRRKALLVLGGWCCLIELASLPIYHRTTSATDVVVSFTIGGIGVLAAKHVARLLDWLDRSYVWWGAAVLWSLFMLVGFWIRFDHVVGLDEYWNRLAGAVAFPFARAQRGTEIGALENLLIKVLAFGVLGFLLKGWSARTSGGKARFSVGTLLWLTLLAIGIEIGQAALFPLIADLTDLIVYGVGAALGGIAFVVFVPPRTSVIKCAGALGPVQLSSGGGD